MDNISILLDFACFWSSLQMFQNMNHKWDEHNVQRAENWGKMNRNLARGRAQEKKIWIWNSSGKNYYIIKFDDWI